MSSTYNGVDSFSESLSLMTGADVPTAQLFRVPLERLLDNTVSLNAAHELQTDLARARSALRLRALDLTTDDTAESMGASQPSNFLAAFRATVAIKVDSTGVFQVYDSAEVDQGGALASITSLVRDAACNTGGRIVAIGVGGNLNARSDNAGGSWSAGPAGIGGAVERIVYSTAGDLFICGGSGTGSVYWHPDGETGTWTSAASGFADVDALAVIGTGAFAGRVVCLGNSGVEPRFSISDDDAVSFSAAAGTVPNANLAAEPGDLQGASDTVSGATLYHVARGLGGSVLRTATSPDGETWTASTLLAAKSGWTFTSRPRLLRCQSTSIGALGGISVIVAPTTDGTCALYASLDFVNWAGPYMVKSNGINAFALAGGKLFMTRDGAIYASDGVRY